MTFFQKAKRSGISRFSAFYSEYQGKLSLIEDFETIKAQYDAAVADIDEAIAQQNTDNGITKELLDQRKAAMAKTVIKFALRGQVKAGLQEMPELANQLNKPVTFISSANKQTAVENAQWLRNVMSQNKGNLANITTADIKAMDDAIEAYQSIMHEPIVTIQHKKSQGTDPLPGLFKKTDKYFADLLGLTISYYGDEDPKMVDEMGLTNKMLLTGMRHNTIDFKVTDADTAIAIEGVSVMSQNQGKSYQTNYQGFASIKTHRNGHFNFTLSGVGYKDLTVGLDVKKGGHSVFELALEAE